MKNLLVLVMLALGFGLVAIYVKKGGVLSQNFDERQERARGKAYSLAFNAMLIWFTLLYMLFLNQSFQISTHFFYASTIFVGAGSWTVYAIWTDAYFNWRDRGKHRGLLFYDLFLAGWSWKNLWEEKDWRGGDWFSYIVEKDGALLFFQALFFSLLALLFLAKWVWEKKVVADLDDQLDKN